MRLRSLLALSLLVSASSAAAQNKKPHVPKLDDDFVVHLRAGNEPLQQRSKRLLVAELRRLEHLLSITPKKTSERPALLRRLAEGYAELAAIATREKALADARARREKKRGRPGRTP